MQTNLSRLTPGQQGMVVSIGQAGALRQRLIAMGVTPGTILTFKRFAPFGDPMEIHIRNSALSIRRTDAKHIVVEIESVDS